MPIHHSQIKKAEKAGYTLEERDGDMVRAFMPSKGLQVFGVSASDAMQQMQAATVLHDDYRVEAVNDSRLVYVTRRSDGHVLVGDSTTPFAAFQALKAGTATFEDPTPYTNQLTAEEQAALAMREFIADIPSDATEQGALEHQTFIEVENVQEALSQPAEILRSESGVALDGAIAFKEGTPAGDCPYSSEEREDDDGSSDEYANFLRWNEEWDAAADEAQEHEDSKGGSVVGEKYRAKYAEMGHPTHCGDWLAETMNEICLNKKGTNLELFEAICAMNKVDTSKYKREGVGWQGRIRMTGRNLLAKRVYEADGVLILPETIRDGKAIAPAEWMAAQRFKRAEK